MSNQKLLSCLIFVYSVNLVAGWDLIECYSSTIDTSETTNDVKLCSSCVTAYNDYSVIKRGCYEDESSLCDSSTGCVRCTEPKCNRGHPIHKCIECDSASDSSCHNLLDNLDPVQCIADSDLNGQYFCYVKWDSVTDGNKRGCISKLSELEECEQNPKTCRMCLPTATGVCNSFVFPDDRRKCIDCYSGSRNCPNDHKTDTVNKYSVSCKSTSDRCVIMNRGYGHQWQLCESDLNDSEKKFCSDHKDRCTFCDKKDNCNWNANLDKLYNNSPALSVCKSIILILPIISRIAF